MKVSFQSVFSSRSSCFPSKRQKIIYPRYSRNNISIIGADNIYIHNVRNMQIVQIIKDLPHGLPSNIMELATSDNCGYLAFPFKTDSGTVRIFDVFQLQDVSCIQAHQSPIAVVKFDPTGYRIATASVRGTCIRVFDSAHGQKLCEFRRGFKEVKMVSLSFSLDNRYLSATSDSETIHIFKIPVDSNPDNAGFLQSVRNTMTTAGGLLNTEERAFLTMPSPLHGQYAVGNFGSLSVGVINFLLINPQGLLYIYSLAENAEGSGFIRPVRQVNLQEKKKATSIIISSLNQEDGSGKTKKDDFFIGPSNFESSKTFEINDRVVPQSTE
ncbi:hypothetical protein RvY_12756-2 [Ramazzottius varieornatus]|uniref:WD repeat domain phosphoinositide-interacting protein 2 n=1 Tax=Ramazzottius varieornatus TaxID=947166 RepID=A0A1D1VKL4_RAMVA|nr:hypothetical protein RvY_12756-2 [Ramazzottius varieornatus]